MKRSIPFLLTTLRLLLGPLALAVVLLGWPRAIFAPLLLAATLSDIYDGVLARRFGVSTPALRRYDSLTDVIYYLFILLATWLLCRPVLSAHWAAILALLGFDHKKLTYRYNGRDFRLTETYGEVLKPIIA